MDSPDRNLTTTSTEAQGSPFFNFLCNLSPIKPVKSVHVAQTFSELSFPPPPPVFVSPRVDAQRSCSSTKSDTAGCVAENGHKAGGIKTFVVPLSVIKRQFSQGYYLEGGNSNVKKNNPDEQFGLASPNSSPSKLGSKYVEQYLADPIEGELYSVGTSKQFTEPSKIEAYAPVNVDPGCLQDLHNSKHSNKHPLTTSAVFQVEGTGKDSMDSTKALDHENFCKILESQDLAEPASQRSARPVERTTMKGSIAQLKFRIEETVNLPCESASTDQQKDANNGCMELPEIAKAASSFTFLMSDSEERISLDVCELKNWQDSSLSDQQESYLAAMKEIINEDVQEGMDTEPYESFYALTESKHGVLGHTKETQTKGSSDGSVAQGFKAGNSLHRGARRRCLDFEASESQEMEKLESMGLVSSSYIQESFAGPDTSIEPSLSERAIATSDAINSESPEASGSAAVVPSISGRKVLPPTPSTLKLSCCSSQIKIIRSLDKLDNQIVCSNHLSGTLPMSSGMPSGIGLHLNSLAGSISLSQITKENDCDNLVTPLKSALPLSENSHLLTMKDGPLTMKDGPSESYTECLLAVNSEGSLQILPAADFEPGLVVSVVDKTRLDQHEVVANGSAQVGVMTSSTCIHSVTLGIKAVEGKLSSGMDNNLSPARKRMLLHDFSQQSDREMHEDCSQQSPQSAKKKRVKPTLETEKTGDGCKHCNCKKSKCLKLYCECFAAGVFCVDSCTCLDCFNKPEFEETVLGTRQQIESRNPLAFAPKIIRTVDSSPIVGEESGDTPASARHKRGCNCKKSQCLKKYCECFQAGVGCSEFCRCEGCKNIYGKKEGTLESENKDVQEEQTEKERTDGEVEIFESKNEFTHLNKQANKKLFPGTPFQCTGQGRLPVKLRSFCRGRLNSDYVKSPTVPRSAMKPLNSPPRLLRSGRVQSGSKAVSTGMHCSQSVGSPASVRKLSGFGQLSPRYDGLVDICTLTPLPQPPLRPTPASESILDRGDSSPTLSNEPSSSCNCSMITGSVFCGALSPVLQNFVPCSPTSTSDGRYFKTHVLNLQTTPGSPLLSSPLCVSRRKSGFGESSDICFQHMEGYSPDFLKDPDAVCSPIQIIKRSSPKQKRVSPHYADPSDMGKRAMTSPALRSGCKFILQAISSASPTASSVVATHGLHSSIATEDQEATNSSNI